MKRPNPAIVTQAAVRRLPRWALWGLTAVYVWAGFIGRDPWRSADMSALGIMQALIQGAADWMHPTLADAYTGLGADSGILLPYWIGAWFLQHTPVGFSPALFVRLPFILMLALVFVCTWYSSYYLTRHPQAQPVAFAFGGEARPTDYARALADGTLLALMACLGLAQIGHETSPALFQLGGLSLLLLGLSCRAYHPVIGLLALGVGCALLTLSGAPVMALAFLAGEFILPRHRGNADWQQHAAPRWMILPFMVEVVMLASGLHLWRWRIEAPALHWDGISGIAQLLVWFTWPAWPLALWGLWNWRRHLFTQDSPRHIALPLWFCTISVACALFNPDPDRGLFLALPTMALLAAYALPTFKRQFASLVDWFTLLFFSINGLIIWVVWVAMQTGFPSQPASNVARLAPGFQHQFLGFALTVAVLASIAWFYLVQWRVGRHRAAIWKSLVLPATGALLCWTLLMTLWLPLLDYAQSYRVWVQRIVLAASEPLTCLQTRGLEPAHIAALRWYLPDIMARTNTASGSDCPWMLVESDAGDGVPGWQPWKLVQHPVGNADDVWLMRRR